MAYPEQSVLMGAGPRDAWFTIGGPGSSIRALTETNGSLLIRLTQSAIASRIHRYASLLPNDLVIPSSGTWDAPTARASLLLADKTGTLKNAYGSEFIDSAWGEYYKHRFDTRLTSIALSILANDTDFARRIEDVLGMQHVTRDRDPPSYEAGEIGVNNFSVELSHNAILPRWGTTPRGNISSEVTIRRICDGSLDNCS